jgi:tetratricopeptide (TPR) repeat protein
MARRASELKALLLVVAVAIGLHGRSVGFGLTYLDDDLLVRSSEEAGPSAPSPWRALARSYLPAEERDHAYYRPLTSASLALDGELSAGAPWSYHATNVLLHALAGALLYLLLGRLGYAEGIALFGALAFVLHPALAGTVCWIPGRDDLLLGVMALAAWLSWHQAQAEPTLANRALHALSFFLALASKEAAVVIPVVLVLDGWLLARRPWSRVLERWLVPAWGIPLGVYLGLRGVVLGPDLGLAWLGRGGGALGFDGLLASLGALVVPREPQILAVPDDLRVLPGVLALVFLVLAARRPEGRRPLAFALAAFFVLSAPSLPALSRLLLESRLYLTAVPLAVALCEVVKQVRFEGSVRLGLGAFVLVLLGLAVLRHDGDFRDRRAFAEAARQASPHSALAHRLLGIAYQLEHEAKLARREYELALAADPDEPLVHNNLAVLWMAEGRLGEAEQELLRELELHPGSREAERNLALVRQAQGGTPPLTH